MAKRTPVSAVMTPAEPASYPIQDLDFNPWPVLADPEQCAAEIEAGEHDAHLALLEHCAKSQTLPTALGAATARRVLLGG
jgi:hypothetical protein